MSMLKLAVIGHLGKDCVVNQVNGKTVINFSAAHTDSYNKADGTKVEKTTWVECAYWSESKVAGYLKKGTMVYVEGVPEVRQYAKNDGTQGVSLTLRVSFVNLLAQPKEAAGAAPAAQGAYTPAAATTPIDDLPF